MPSVLVVDDDPFITSYVQAALPEWHVQSALDGIAALDLLRRASVEIPDLILLDISMPGLDGYITCVRLRALVPNGRIAPHTGTEGAQTDYLIDLGCDSPIYKGMPPWEFGRRIRTLMLQPPPPLRIPPATLTALQQQAALQEEHARRQWGAVPVAVLASRLIEQLGVKALLDSSGCRVIGIGMNPVQLYPLLHQTRCCCIVAPARNWTDASTVARNQKIPLLLIIDTLLRGHEVLQHYHQHTTQWPSVVGFLMVSSLLEYSLSDTIRSLAAGTSVIDPVLKQPLHAGEASDVRIRILRFCQRAYGITLNDSQIDLLVIFGYGKDIRAAADEMNTSVQAIHQKRHRLATALGIPTPEIDTIVKSVFEA